MSSLRCDLPNGLHLSVRKFSDGADSKRNQLFLDLCKNDSDSKPIASKIIPWPSNEEAPTELLYSNIDGIVKLKNIVTIAEVPLRLDNLGLDYENNTGCKVYKSFTSQLLELDSSQILDCVHDITQTPISKNDWKKLKTLLVSGEIIMTLPIREQEQLWSALMQNKDSRFFEDICIAIQNTRLFGYRKLQEMAFFCIENGFMQIVIDGLGKHWYSEEIKAKILEYIANENGSDTSLLEKLLISGISRKKMAVAAKTISPVVSSIIMKQLMNVFCDITKKEYHSSALMLISTLIDVTGSQICLEKDLQGSITEIMDIVTDFAAVSDTFLKFEAQMAVQNYGKQEIETLFSLRRLKIKPRRIDW